LLGYFSSFLIFFYTEVSIMPFCGKDFLVPRR
jgi:hypothetical protein